jgi:stage II sporulation protein D
MFRTGSFLLSILLAIPAWGSVPAVKVLIAKSLKNVVVEGTDIQKTIHTQKKSLSYQGRRAINFDCQFSRSTIGPKSPLLVASLSSPTGLISWGKNKYQGELHLVTNPEKESCDLVNNIPLEAYLRTLLAKEMNGTWPVEALKAQAVAARTYAYERMQRKQAMAPEQGALYDLESSEKDQVSGTFFDITEKTLLASKETEGQILVGPTGKVAPAFFHSKCGGKTLRPDQVWGGVEEGYRSVNCTFCRSTGLKDWENKVRGNTLTGLIDQALRRYYAEEPARGELKVMPDSPENSELRVYLGDRLHIVKKSYLRNLAGRELLPSNNFTVKGAKGEFLIQGKGYGHGVGLCQLGALELAKRGYDYRQILSFYFPRHSMKKVY